MLAPDTVRTRKIRNGIRGWRWTRSMTRNASRSATDAKSSSIVRAVPQPTKGAREIAYTSRASPPVTVIAPNGS